MQQPQRTSSKSVEHYDPQKEKLLERSVKRRVVLGHIGPEHKTSEQQQAKIQENDKNTKTINKEVKEYKKGDAGYLAIEGSPAKVFKAQNVLYKETEAAQKAPHIERPYLYATRIRERESTLKQGDQEKKAKKVENFWNTSNNIGKSFQSTDTKKKPPLLMPNIVQELKSMDVRQRAHYYEQSRERGDIVHEFFCEIRRLLKYSQGSANEEQQENEEEKQLQQSSAVSKLNTNLYKSLKNLVEQRFAQAKQEAEFLVEGEQFAAQTEQIQQRKKLLFHLLVDLSEFREFILSLGYDSLRIDEIDAFYRYVHDANAFADQPLQPAVVSLNSSSLKRRSATEMISMRTFLWNFRRFLRAREQTANKYNHVATKQVNVNIREELKPWKKDYKILKRNLVKLRESEKLVQQKAQEHDLAPQLQDLITRRDGNIALLRAIANQLYAVLREKMIDYDELKDDFIQKVLKNSAKFSLLEDFVDGFRLRREFLYQQNPQQEKLTVFDLSDFAEFMRHEKYEQTEVETLITLIKKVYANSGRELNQKISLRNFRQFLDTYAKKKKDSYGIYQEFITHIDDKFDKMMQRHSLLRQKTVLNVTTPQRSVAMRLFETGARPASQVDDRVRAYCEGKLQRSTVGQIILKYIRKLQDKILRSFFIVSSLIKLVHSPTELTKNRMAAILAVKNPDFNDKIPHHNHHSLQMPPQFTRKFLFSDAILVITRQSCKDEEENLEASAAQPQENDIERTLKIFHTEATRLKEALYQWRYDENIEEEAEDLQSKQETEKVELLTKKPQSRVLQEQTEQQKLQSVEKFKASYNNFVGKKVVPTKSEKKVTIQEEVQEQPNRNLFLQHVQQKISAEPETVVEKKVENLPPPEHKVENLPPPQRKVEASVAPEKKPQPEQKLATNQQPSEQKFTKNEQHPIFDSPRNESKFVVQAAATTLPAVSNTVIPPENQNLRDLEKELMGKTYGGLITSFYSCTTQAFEVAECEDCARY